MKIVELEAQVEAMESQVRAARNGQRSAEAERDELRDKLKAAEDEKSKLQDELHISSQKLQAAQGALEAEKARSDALEEQVLAKVKELAMVKNSANSSM